MDFGHKADRTLVARNDLHHGGFANDHGPCFGQLFNHLRDHERCADAANFLVIGQCELDRVFQVCRDHLRH